MVINMAMYVMYVYIILVIVVLSNAQEFESDFQEFESEVPCNIESSIEQQAKVNERF